MRSSSVLWLLLLSLLPGCATSPDHQPPPSSSPLEYLIVNGVFDYKNRYSSAVLSAHAWKGDSGGPCFREDAAGNRWLAGIISTGQITPQGTMTHFTSVFHHRAWIQAQMDLSSKKQNSRQKDATR